MFYIVIAMLISLGIVTCVQLFSYSRLSRKMAREWQEQADTSKTLGSKVFAQGMANSWATGNSAYATEAMWRSQLIDKVEISLVRTKTLLSKPTSVKAEIVDEKLLPVTNPTEE